MSAYNQNFAYVFGEKKKDVKENIMSKEQFKEISKSAEKYLNKGKNGTETRTAK